jgi:predicted dehydrogenase
METVNIGIIGVGHLGRFHALNYNEIPEANLIGVFDVNAERSKQIASECGCRSFDNVNDLLKSVDAVSISVPTDQHFSVTKKALEQHIHCLIEKPITSTLDQADALIQLAEDNDLILQVGHIERYNPAMLAIQNISLHPQFIESHRLAPFNPRGTEVAVILDLMIHDIDIILHIVKQPVSKIDASGVAVVSDSIDIANARIHFKNGCIANLTASRISQKKMRKMRLFQKNAYISIDFLDKISEIYSLEKQPQKKQRVLGEIGIGENKRYIIYNKPKTKKINSLKMELESFAYNLLGKHTEAITGKEGRMALETANQILEKLAK